MGEGLRKWRTYFIS